MYCRVTQSLSCFESQSALPVIVPEGVLLREGLCVPVSDALNVCDCRSGRSGARALESDSATLSVWQKRLDFAGFASHSESSSQSSDPVCDSLGVCVPLSVCADEGDSVSEGVPEALGLSVTVGVAVV